MTAFEAGPDERDSKYVPPIFAELRKATSWLLIGITVMIAPAQSKAARSIDARLSYQTRIEMVRPRRDCRKRGFGAVGACNGVGAARTTMVLSHPLTARSGLAGPGFYEPRLGTGARLEVSRHPEQANYCGWRVAHSARVLAGILFVSPQPECFDTRHAAAAPNGPPGSLIGGDLGPEFAVSRCEDLYPSGVIRISFRQR
jgi:hypothetical protein